VAEPQTALHLLPEDAYPFSIAFYWADEGRLHIEWAITLLSPKGANPMEMSSVKIPPVKKWCGHEVECVMTSPDVLIAALLAAFDG
jgi:hypothetical protein